MFKMEHMQGDRVLRRSERARLFLGASLAFTILMVLPYVTDNSNVGGNFNLETMTHSYEENVKYVALTYDDGPNPIYTKELLQILEEENVHASFFMMGRQVENYPQVVKEVADKGHLIGNHTYSHVNVCQLSEERVKEEIQKTNELIYKSCGQSPEWFRPPFGCNREKLISGMQMYQVFWNVDPLDWSVQNTGTIVNHVLKYVEDGDIILMHDAYPTTIEATKILIPKLREMGYDFVTVDEMIQP